MFQLEVCEICWMSNISFTLTYEWPEKFLRPEIIFKVDMRRDRGFTEKNEFVEYRDAARKLKLQSHHPLPVSTITVHLPFMVQRNNDSFSKDLRRFGTSNSAILSRGSVTEDFVSLTDLAKQTKTSDHKVYFMILRFTRV